MLQIGWSLNVKQVDWAVWDWPASEVHLKILPVLGYLFCSIGNVTFLNLAMRRIPLATCIAAWMGMTALGLAAIDWLYYDVAVSFEKAVFLMMVVGGIIGLKMTFSPPELKKEEEDRIKKL